MPRSPKPRVPRLSKWFYRREPDVVARALLGQTLVHIVDGQRIAGRIVETEAYLGIEDKACHSFGGRRTGRTETMYLGGGTSYVYLNYGMHHMFNIVVAQQEDPKAVLIRALEPTEGIAQMFQRRPKAKTTTDLCSGPGKLGAALGIDRSHNAVDLVTSERLFVERTLGREKPPEIVVCPRVGIDYAAEWASAPLRYYIAENPHVSRHVRSRIEGPFAVR